MHELLGWDAVGQAHALRNGDVSDVELVDAAIAAIEDLDPKLDATLFHRFDAARREVEEGLSDGPFRGVPILLKDLVHHMAGEPFHEACAGVARRNYVAPRDTHLVSALRAAGFVVLGKTKCSEFGVLPTAEPAMYPPARNPWDTERATMGSSGGSAAAVAARMVAVASGNDLGGSLRVPAAACGVVGMKPSRGRTSLAPDFGDLMNGCVAEHVITRSVRDTAAIVDVVSGPVTGDPYALARPAVTFAESASTPPQGLRIGRLVHAPAGMGQVDAACVEAVDGALAVFEGLGHDIEASAPAAVDDPVLGISSLHVAAAYAEFALDWWRRTLGEELTADDVEVMTWWLAEMSRGRNIADYLATVEWIQAFARRVDAWWDQGFDVLVTPTMAVPPPPLGWASVDPDNPLATMIRVGETTPFTMLWNLTGAPAISLPFHLTPEGLPVGVQLVARLGREDVLLGAAAQLEQAMPGVGLTPPISA